MNRHTPQQMQFVLYSTHQLVSSNGSGFWSNTEGWVEFKEATRFTVSSVPACNMPINEGLDAKWIMWEPGSLGWQTDAVQPRALQC
jgi:hypothetical protein|nr:hypothetical protein [uncultured Rhodoferax sp.]